MKKIISGSLLLLMVILLGGCEKEEPLNPLSPSSMVNTYEDSKGKINEATQKQNEATTKALEDSGINE
ncbi:MAG: hypothetical protein RBS77_00825 [Candidatus Moranbacteria bacterium]|nr:hypothetical protein [Candidatus Moranbacteria bacterium]